MYDKFFLPMHIGLSTLAPFTAKYKRQCCINL